MKPYFEDEGVIIYHGDCRDILPMLETVDLLLTDPPYGVTQNKQDVPVDLTQAFLMAPGQVVFAQQPYTTDVLVRFRSTFRYDIVWDKVLVSGHLNAKKQPMRQHESILVFGDVTYHPQTSRGKRSHGRGEPKEPSHNNYGAYGFVDNRETAGTEKQPTSIVRFSKPHPSVALHRTAKPIELLAYLVATYTEIAQTILDPFMGSGTALVAAKDLGRKAIGIEISEQYCEIAALRLLGV